MRPRYPLPATLRRAPAVPTPLGILWLRLTSALQRSTHHGRLRRLKPVSQATATDGIWSKQAIPVTLSTTGLGLRWQSSNCKPRQLSIYLKGPPLDLLQWVEPAHRCTRLEWNPALDKDCSGLYYGWWVCVGAQPRSSLSLTYFTEPGPVIIPTYSLFTPLAFLTVNSSFTATPTQSGLASNCKAFYSASPVSWWTPML